MLRSLDWSPVIVGLSRNRLTNCHFTTKAASNPLAAFSCHDHHQPAVSVEAAFYLGDLKMKLIAANDNSPRPATVFLLMAQYHGKAVISVDEICRDYFPHLDSAKFIRKVGAGDIVIPMIRIEASQKTAKGVHINDLAEYIDRQADAARKECRQLAG
jgi:hypothetical protein